MSLRLALNVLRDALVDLRTDHRGCGIGVGLRVPQDEDAVPLRVPKVLEYVEHRDYEHPDDSHEGADLPELYST